MCHLMRKSEHEVEFQEVVEVDKLHICCAETARLLSKN